MQKRKNGIIRLFLFLAMLLGVLALLSLSASAAPAPGREIRLTQPDGTSFLAAQAGDEYFHYYKTDAGDILLRDDGGTWRYAIVSSKDGQARLIPGIAAYGIDAKPANAATPEGLRATPALWERPEPEPLPGQEGGLSSQGAENPYLGNQTLLIILVDFSDVSIRYEADWAEHVFGLDQMSVRDYYRSATMGAIDIVPARESYAGAGAANDGIVRVKLNYNHPNSGNGNSFFDDIADSKIAADAIRAAGQYVDYRSYDRNGNLRITPDELHIMIVCAGYEASCGYETPSVWGHRWTVLPVYGFISGRIFTSYMAIGEIHSDHEATIGVLCHELGHDLGLPDLYGQPEGIDLYEYSLMSGGSWNTADDLPIGSVPAYPDPYCLEQLGIIASRRLGWGESYAGDILSHSTGAKNLLRLPDWKNDGKSYFLIENRQFEGYDRGLMEYDWDYDEENDDWIPTSTRGGVLVFYVQDVGGGTPIVELIGLQRYWRPYYSAEREKIRLNDTAYPASYLCDGYYAWFDMLCDAPAGASMPLSISPLTQHTISYNVGYGSQAPDPQIKTPGQPATLSALIPEREDCRFAGWAVRPWAQTPDYQPGDLYTKDQGVILYAIWRWIGDPPVLSHSTLRLQYKTSGAIKVYDHGAAPYYWSKNALVATVDQNGTITAQRRGTAVICAEVDGGVAECTVEVYYAWWQWLIAIFLFGWIWY